MFQFFLARDCLAKQESDSHRQWNIGDYSGDGELFAGWYQRDFIPHSLSKRGLQWGFTQRGQGKTLALSVQQQTFKNRVGRWELRRYAVVTNVSFSLCIKMGLVLATEVKVRQTATNTVSWQCVEANGVGVVASNDGKQTNGGVFW